jgi:fatty acid-binding protein DegV
LLPRFARFIVRRTALKENAMLRIFVAHGDRPEQGERLMAQLRLRLPPERVEFIALTDLGPAIGVHGGPGTLVVAIHQATRNAS